MNFAAFIYTFIAILCGLIIPGCAVATGAVTEIKVLLGPLFLMVISGSGALLEFAYEKRRTRPDFIRDKAHILEALTEGTAIKDVAIMLGPEYRVIDDSAGVSFDSGRCRVVEVEGPVTVTRVETKNATVAKVRVDPRRPTSVSDSISELLSREKPRR